MPRGTSIYDEAYLQQRLWYPTNITSLAGWWDASDTTTMTFGTGISQWNSKVGSAYVSQSTGSSQPTFTPTTRTGAPGVTFATQYLKYSGAPAGFNTGTSAMTLVASGMATTSSSYNVAIEYGFNNVGEGRQVLSNASTGYALAGIAGRTGLQPGLSNWVNNGLVTSLSVPSGSSVQYTASVSGVDTTVGSAQAVSNVGALLGIGAVGDGNYIAPGIILYDIMFFNDALSAYDVRRIEGFCAWKANIQQYLTANHPFKNRPPMIGD